MSDKEREKDNLGAALQMELPLRTKLTVSATVYNFPSSKKDPCKGREDALKRILEFAAKLPSK